MKRETDVAAPMVAWLREWQWDVWQEVEFGGCRADIVAVRHGRLMIVEAKAALTFDVIAQAQRWPVHYRAIVVPYGGGGEGRRLALQVCRDLRLGVYLASRARDVREEIPPRLLRGADRMQAVRRYLKTLQHWPRDYAAAGSLSGTGWSSYRGTMDRVRAFIAAHPGCTVKEIVGNVYHHYASPASATAAIPKWLQTVEKWCRTEVVGGRLRFYVQEEETPGAGRGGYHAGGADKVSPRQGG